MEYADIAVLTLGAFSLVAIITMGYCGARIESERDRLAKRVEELIDQNDELGHTVLLLEAANNWLLEGKQED